jgi:hypothetical protein
MLVEHYFRVWPEDIAYVKYVIESYEAVGFLRTIDPGAPPRAPGESTRPATLVLLVVPDFRADGARILESIEHDVWLERMEKPADLGDDWLVGEFVDPDDG